VAGEEKERLSRLLFDERGALNAGMVGKSAQFIARSAGISVPESTRVLIAELDGVGKAYPLSREKLSPVLAFFTVDGWRDACHRCIELLQFGGIGHTLVIHSRDNDVIMKFALEKPAFRILVNTQAALGAVGYTNGLDPSLTLGAGTWGGSIVSDNVTARHLINIKRLAYETNPLNPSTNGGGGGSDWMHAVERRLGVQADGIPDRRAQTQGPRATFGGGMTAAEVDAVLERFRKSLR
jgi:acetaldehyde dehydrogenase (acetylating)